MFMRVGVCVLDCVYVCVRLRRRKEACLLLKSPIATLSFFSYLKNPQKITPTFLKIKLLNIFCDHKARKIIIQKINKSPTILRVKIMKINIIKNQNKKENN